MTLRVGCFMIVATAFAFTGSAQAATVVQPALSYGIADNPRGGLADGYQSETSAVAEQSSGYEARAVLEFSLASLAGMTIADADFAFMLSSGNNFGTENRTFQVFTFSADGVRSLADFSQPDGTLIQSVTYNKNTQTAFSLDVTAALQEILASGASHAGFLFDDQSPDSRATYILSASLTVTASTATVPEPASALLAFAAAPLAARQCGRRRSYS